MTDRAVRTVNSRSAGVTDAESRLAVTLLKGTSVALIASFAGQLIGYAYGAYAARMLGAESFGVYSLAISVTGLAATFATLGLARGGSYFTSMFLARNAPSQLKGTVIFALATSGAFALALALLLNQLATAIASWFELPQLAHALRLLCWSIPFGVTANVIGELLVGFGAVESRSVINVFLHRALRLGIAAAFVLLGWRIAALLQAEVLSSAIVMLVAALAFRRLYRAAQIRTGEYPSFPVAEILRYSLPLMCMAAMTLLTGRLQMVFLGKLGSATMVGRFAGVLLIASSGALLLSAFNLAFRPHITRLYSNSELGRLQHAYRLVTRWTMAIGCLWFLLLVQQGDALLALMGPTYRGMYPVLVIASLGQFVNLAVGPTGAMLVATGNSLMSLANAVGNLALVAVLSLMLIPRFSVLGAAIAYCLSLVILNLVVLFEVMARLGFSPLRPAFVKPLLAAAVTAAVLALPWWERAGIALPATVRPVLLTIAYFGGVWLLGLDDTERRLASRAGARISRLGSTAGGFLA